MRDDGIGSELDQAKYAATGMDFWAGRGLAGEELDDAADAGDLADARYLAAEPDPTELTVEQRVGVALLRLRLYRGWSQSKLEAVSGVDQTMISRLETARSRGTSIRRLFAILTALRTREITFGPGPRTLPQSSWEDAMYGDLWERAGRVAEARLNRRRSA